VRAILCNPRYTGRQVWNRQRRDEVLLDVDDVALGHETKLRWNDRADWVWSAEQTHDPLVSVEDFAHAQEQMGAGRNRPAVRKARGTPRPYPLRGLLVCGLCGRRMAGQHNHGRTHYRCRYPTEYALANDVDHPRTVYVREDEVMPALDAWLASLFDPANLDETCRALAAASGPNDADEASIEAARRKLADCDGRLVKYRAALDNGADPTVVAAWIAEVQGDRLAAERTMSSAGASILTAEDVREVIDGLGDFVTVLAKAKPTEKAKVYADLGITLTYRPAEQIVSVEAAPAVCQSACRRTDRALTYTVRRETATGAGNDSCLTSNSSNASHPPCKHYSAQQSSEQRRGANAIRSTRVKGASYQGVPTDQHCNW